MEREMNTYKVTFTVNVYMSVCPDYWGGNEKQAILKVLSENFMDYASFMDYENDLQYEKVATEIFDEDEDDDFI